VASKLRLALALLTTLIALPSFAAEPLVSGLNQQLVLVDNDCASASGTTCNADARILTGTITGDKTWGPFVLEENWTGIAVQFNVVAATGGSSQDATVCIQMESLYERDTLYNAACQNAVTSVGGTTRSYFGPLGAANTTTNASFNSNFAGTSANIIVMPFPRRRFWLKLDTNSATGQYNLYWDGMIN